MSSFGLVLSAFRRHIGRTVFTILSVATAFAIFVVLAAIEHGLDGHISMAAAQRLDTEAAINAPLPVSYGGIISATPHVTAVTYDTAFEGYFRDPKLRVLVIGDAAPALFDVYPEVTLPNDQKESFLHDRNGAVVSDRVAAKMGWHIGQAIPVQDGPAQANGSTTWLFHIDGIYQDRLPEGSATFMNAHYDYINDGIQPSARKDTVDKFDEFVDDPKNVDGVAAAIDARFSNASPDTRTQTIQEEALSSMRQFGDIGAIITAVGFAVFASMLLITGNTMANSVRERFGEFAMMRAIGFGRFELAFIIFREAAILISVGAALGVLAGWELSRLMEPLMTQVLLAFSPTWTAFALAAFLALLFALATGFLPGRRVAQMPVAATLRRM